MSYNTRRTGGRGQTTQVNYHQPPTRPVTANATQPARNPGYTTAQPVNYNTSSQPAFSTQQPGYTSTTATTKGPAPPTQQTPVQQPAPPATPDVKKEPLTPASTPSMDTSENGDSADNKPIWKKKPFAKLSNKEKKLRQNARLKRFLNPKNALTFLNEIRPGGVKFVSREASGWGFVATAEVDGKTFSGHGLTVSKAKINASEQALRQILLEQLSKSQTAQPTPPADADQAEPKKETEMEVEQDTPTEGGEDGEPAKKKLKTVQQQEDDMPWGSLAAFALHKLFEEWQKDDMPQPGPPQENYDEDMNEDSYFRRAGPDFGFPRRFPPGPGMFGRGRGFVRGAGFTGPRRFPPPPPPPPSSFPNQPKPALGSATLYQSMVPMKKIPEDANKRHPVMLLNQLKPHLVYNEFKEGDLPNTIFKITINLDGNEYVGRGKNKKDAKKMAAKAALATMGVHYEEDN